jgi:thiosulfate:glutathione sulfurtransferase
MLRAPFKSSISIIAVQSRAKLQLSRPVLVLGIRFNSLLTPEQRKANNKVKKELQKDWVAPILTYETVKQKSQQPSEVGFLLSLFLNWLLVFDSRMHI